MRAHRRLSRSQSLAFVFSCATLWNLSAQCSLAQLPPGQGTASKPNGGAALKEPAGGTNNFARPLVDSAPASSPASLPPIRDAASVMVRMSSGLQYQDITKGAGSMPASGQRLTVEYTGYLSNGPKFDSSIDRGAPFVFTLDSANVIPGWNEGLADMHVGGTRRLIIPPQLAYGESGANGVIPPNSTLVFDVTLLNADTAPADEQVEPQNVIPEFIGATRATVSPPVTSTSSSISSEAVYSTTWCFLVLWAFLIIGFFIFSKPKAGKYSEKQLAWDKDGMQFGADWHEGLLGRLKREWSDLHAVDFEGELSSSAVREWKGVNGCTLTLDFKSGGGVVLELENLTRDQTENLLLSVEQNADQSVLSKRALFFERQLMAVDNDIPLSYTTIWTDALESQFGATHFVPLRTGSRLQEGRYEVRMQLASGGLSAVYVAQHTSGRRVILKESVLPLDTDERTRAKAKEMFEREARILAKLDHPQIAKVLDFFVEDGRDYIILEYIPGMSLRQVVQSDHQKALKNIVSWSKQIADLVFYLHKLEPPIVHRDLTPDNLLIRDDGKIALIDFGASNEFVSQATGTLIGKQAYIPPEQFRGKAEPKSDVYAFGATVYFLLTGTDPVPLSRSQPAEVPHGVPASIKELIADCTQLNPGSRPDSEELALMCTSIAVGKPSRSREELVGAS